MQYPPILSFFLEHFAVARGADPKQFRRGIEQLEQEGELGAPISLESPARTNSTIGS